MNGAEASYRAEEFEMAKSMFWEAQNLTQSPTMGKHNREIDPTMRLDVIGNGSIVRPSYMALLAAAVVSLISGCASGVKYAWRLLLHGQIDAAFAPGVRDL